MATTKEETRSQAEVNPYKAIGDEEKPELENEEEGNEPVGEGTPAQEEHA